jgi:hypothetical protein
MNKQLADIINRRRLLLAEIETQRMAVSRISQHWQKPLAVVDVGLKAVRLIRQHPALVAGGATALVAFRNKGSVGLAWHLLRRNPPAIIFGLKYIASAIRSSGDKNKTAHDR